MKYVKMLGLLAVAAAALMAFAGSASATVTSPTGTKYTGNLTATSTNAILTGGVTISCSHSTVSGSISNGATGGTVSELTFTGCGSSTVKVIDLTPVPNEKETHHGGTLEITNGDELYSTNARVTVLTHFSIFNITAHCIYRTNHTKIGTLTDSHETGGKAVLDIDADIPQEPTSEICGNAEWEGNYTVNTPNPAYLD